MHNQDEFLNIIKLRIDDKASKNKRLEYLKKKIKSKKATFADTAEYSEIISNITGSTFSNFISRMNEPGIKSYVCEELLKSRYADVNVVMSEVQKSLDEKTGINIAPQQADFPIDRVKKVADSLEDTTVSQDVIERRADSAVSNVAKSFHDDYIQKNAEFRSDAGIKCTITRTALGKCCAWCDAVCGTYVYGEEPEGIYRRHDNCNCEVIFENGRTVQDVWSKKTWEKPSGSNDYEPTSFSTEQAKALQDKNMPKPFTNDDKSGIINSTDTRGAQDVHYVGKIDKNIYSCVTKDIVTDEVVITDNQVEHIKSRHPNDYERYFKYVSDIIKNPDYILEANKPNTAFVLKHITDNDKRYQLILRLKTSEDPQNYKNSVITFLKVGEKRYNRYLRTKKILYKSE